jgi:DNA-binding FrmR family transcriptional regulator
MVVRPPTSTETARMHTFDVATNTPGGYAFTVTSDTDAPEHGYTARKSSHLKRLRRIEGQVRGLQRMVDEDKYCIDVLTQVSAVTRALQVFSLELLQEHLSHCVVQAAAKGGAEADEKVREASDAIARLVRS